PSVRRRGYVEDIETELLTCDVLLVPTDSAIGFRTRIAEAMSYGCCVVAHESNALGMPELNHGHNALLPQNGADLAKLTAQCLRDPDLRQRLGVAGRRIFEERLDGHKVCDEMVEMLEAVVAGRRASHRVRSGLKGADIDSRKTQAVSHATL